MPGPITVRPAGLVLALLEKTVRSQLEPRVRNVPLWESGLGDVAAELLRENGVSNEPVSAVDLARAAGLLKKRGTPCT